MKFKVVSTNCSKVLDGRSQVLIVGVSINNSHFSEKNLERLLRWSSMKGSRIRVMIPDQPMIDTFMALGYSEKVATRTARLKGNALENKCHMIIGRHRLDNVHIVRWSQLVDNSVYKEALVKVSTLYQNDLGFKRDIFEATASVLKANGVLEPENEKIEIGTNFLLKELAFITHACFIFHEQKFCYVYHKSMPILNNLIEGIYKIDVSEDIGSIVVE
jgi:tRNA-dependent cyclodipeptide synthase